MTANDSEDKRCLNRVVISSIGLLVVLAIVVTLAKPSIPGEASPTPPLTPPPRPSVYEGRLPTGANAVLGLGGIAAIDLSPDGKSLAVLTGIGVGVYKIDDLSLVWFDTVNAENLDYGKLRWSADGQWLAVKSWKETTTIWNAITGETPKATDELPEFDWPATEEKNVTSPDGSMIVSVSSNRVVIQNAETKSEIETAHQIVGTAIESLAWSADGATLASYSRCFEGMCFPHTTSIWDMNTAAPLDTQFGDTVPGFEVINTFSDKSPDGSRYLTWEASEAFTLRDVETGQVIREISLNRVSESSRLYWAWSPDSRLLAGMLDMNLYFWDTRTGNLVKEITGFPFGYGIAFNPDGKLLATTVGGAVIVYQVP